MKKVTMPAAGLYAAGLVMTLSCHNGVGESHYVFNRSPLEQVSCAELPLGAVRPRPWAGRTRGNVTTWSLRTIWFNAFPWMASISSRMAAWCAVIGTNTVCTVKDNAGNRW